MAAFFPVCMLISGFASGLTAMSLQLLPADDQTEVTQPNDQETPWWQPHLMFRDYSQHDFVVPRFYGPAEPLLRQFEEEIRSYVTALHGERRSDLAEQVGHDLARIQAIDSPESLPVSEQARLHVVGFYEGHGGKQATAEVVVTDRSGPVILCVCAYSSINWTINASDGVNLQKVIVAGYEQQKIVRSPPKVPVEGQLGAVRQTAYYFDAYAQAGDWMVVDDRLKTLTGLEVSTRQGQSEAPAAPVIVGPENPDWMSQTKLALLRPLLSDSRRFRAITFDRPLLEARTPVLFRAGGGGEGSEFGGNSSVSVAIGSIFGPFEQTMQPVSGDIHRLEHDRKDRFYTLHKHAVATVDSITGTLAEINIPELESIHSDWPTALDQRRSRLYFWGRELYSFELPAGPLHIHRETGSGDIVAMVYSSKHDCLFGVAAPYDGSSGSSITQIHRFNLRGATVSTVSIDVPIQSRGRPSVQMVHGRLVLTPGYTPGREQICHVLDPASGRTVFSCRRQPRSVSHDQ